MKADYLDRVQAMIESQEEREQMRRKKITQPDTKHFLSSYPLVYNAVMGNNKGYIDFDDDGSDNEIFKGHEARLQDCEDCINGEGCVNSTYNNRLTSFVQPKKNPGCFVQGVDADGCFIFGACNQWKALMRREKLLWFGIPPRFHHCTFENFIPQNEKAKKVVEGCRGYVDGHLRGEERGGLLLSGPYGTGKTHLSVAMAVAMLDGGANDIRFAVVPKLLALTRKAFNSDDKTDYIGDAGKARVLVLDDVGAEKISEWVREQLFLLINERYEQQLPTIITTNASMDELENRIGGASVSRIWGMCKGYVLDGDDYRRKREKGGTL